MSRSERVAPRLNLLRGTPSSRSLHALKRAPATVWPVNIAASPTVLAFCHRSTNSALEQTSVFTRRFFLRFTGRIIPQNGEDTKHFRLCLPKAKPHYIPLCLPYDPKSLTGPPFGRPIGPMSKRKRATPRAPATPAGLHFGQKVGAWLWANANASPRPIEPSSVRQLAAHIGMKIGHSHVLGRMLKRGNPKLDVALRIARVMRTSLDSLADPSRPFPEPAADAAIQAWWKSLEATAAASIRDAWSPEVEAAVLAFAPRRGTPPARGA